MNAARWVTQNILDPHPSAPLKVHAVWFSMYRGDARDRWRSSLLDDPRVEHWWDEKRIVGRRLLEELRPYATSRAAGSRVFKGNVLWDAFLLFDSRAEWGTALPRPVSWGYTILAARDALAKETTSRLASNR